MEPKWRLSSRAVKRTCEHLNYTAAIITIPCHYAQEICRQQGWVKRPDAYFHPETNDIMASVYNDYTYFYSR